MPTQYPILYNRPIDQWKVAELKEELKRRKLAIRGLKDDLIKRLDEAIRNERDSIEEEAAIHTEKDSNEKEEAICVEKDSAKDEGAICTKTDFSMKEEAVFTEKDSAKDTIENGFDCDQESKVECKDVETKSTEAQMVEDIRVLDENQAQEVDDYAAVVDIDGSPKGLGEGKSQEAELTDTTDSVELVGQPIDLAVSMETNITISETVITQTTSSEQETQNNGAQIENEDPKPLHEDAMLDVSDPNNQVSEVNPVLGFQVKSESISADSLSINEKNELKDNLNADNFHLELEVIKPEMVQPSSSDIPSKDDDDIQVQHENQSFIEEIDDTSATYMDLSKKNDSADGESEKINLDRSLVVDSMEEDILESKHDDSNHDSDEVGDRSEVCVVKEESPDDASGLGLSFDKNVIPTESKNTPVVPAEKRKPEEQEVVGNNEPSKRQRRWNSETLKIPELQTSNLTTSTTPKDTIQSATPKRNFTRSESTLSGGDTPKERVVPQSPKPPTNSLRIDRFLRPFTLKAVQELLAKTGTVCSFWMDHIKTHCYVTYSSVEEAIETRNALYNLQWPANGGRLLVAEFVEPQEVKLRAEAPPQSPAAPVSTSPITPPAPSPFQPQPSSRQKTPRQQLPPPPPPPLSDPPEARERLPLPPPPPLHKKPDQPIVTLDDLFKKTKATPRIYYLPLSEEQVAAKLAQKGKNSK